MSFRMTHSCTRGGGGGGGVQSEYNSTSNKRVRKTTVYRRSAFKCEDAINANENFPPDLQLLNSQLQYYVRGDESSQAQNTIIELTISLKTRKHNLITAHLNVGLRYCTENIECYIIGPKSCTFMTIGRPSHVPSQWL